MLCNVYVTVESVPHALEIVEHDLNGWAVLFELGG